MSDKFRRGFAWAGLGLLLAISLNVFVSPVQSSGNYTIYLPLIFNPVISLPNGDFESGDANWIIEPAGAQLIFDQAALPEGIIPPSGSHAAWLGDHKIPNQASTNAISQPINVPIIASALNFSGQLRTVNPLFCYGYQDRMEVIIVEGVKEEPVHLQYLNHNSNTYSWTSYIVDLSSFAGRTVMLTLRVTTSQDCTADFFFDDFFFSSQ
ncbi:hypothetical protein EG834_14425 [bacterium]|nr:hypothetical protein [bacterium]